MSKLIWSLFLLAMVASFNVYAIVGDPVAGLAKSKACVACHGADGNSPTPIWPKIAGLSESYILQQLQEYKRGPNGLRYDPTMFGIVQNLSQQDLADLAAYYASLKMTLGAAQADLVALGQSIYRGGDLSSAVPACAACHGATGLGNNLANFPRLSGQNSGYVVNQLNNFKNGTRKNGPNSIMQDIAARMTDKEIEAVASYVAGLH